jgi:hypothetical protein
MDKFATKEELDMLSEKKVSISKLDGFLSEHVMKSDLARLRGEVISSISSIQGQVTEELTRASDAFAKKADLTNLGGLIDKKANIEDINAIITELHKELKRKVSKSGFAKQI